MGQTIVTDVTSSSQLPADTFPSFGVLLKYLRRRARLTQAELAIAVGFSREQITKLENGQRTPDKITLQALFLPALDLASDDQLALRLLELAEIVQTPKEADTGPAPGTLGARGAPTNLPAPLTSFVGRVREVAEVTRLLSTTRLLALTGAGGAGKTRLALEVGAALLHTFRDGVWLVELAPVTDPLLVAPAVAAALEAPTASGRLPEQLVADHLHDKHLLLILDNCEHLLAACACLAEAWLRAAPQLQILATSRESLGMLSVVAWQVPSLQLPDLLSATARPLLPEEALHAEAVQLFVERARAIQPNWELQPTHVQAVVQICRRLDGMPLAIELAASRTRVMSVQEIALRLDDRFRLLAGGNRTALPRHQTLRAMVDWSYAMLSPPEQRLFRQLAVFVGGWTLETAEWICGNSEALDLLTQLADKSLVLVDERADVTRYRMLETLRAYGYEQLTAAGEEDAAGRQLLDWCQELAEAESPYRPATHGQPWFVRLERELENIWAALGWAIRHDRQAALELIAGIWQLWFWRGYWREGADWAERVFAVAENLDTPAGARALVGASNLAGRAGDYVTAVAWLTRGMAIAEAVDDLEARIWANISLSVQTSDHQEASDLLETAAGLARAAGNLWLAADALCVLGDRQRAAGDPSRAAECYSASLALFRQLGSMDMIAWPLGNLGRLAFERGEYARARAAFAESVASYRAFGNRPGTVDWLLQLALAELRSGDADAVQAALAECLPLSQAIGNHEAVLDCLVLAAGLAELRGQGEQAAELLGAASGLLAQFNLLHHGADPAGFVEYTRRVARVRAKLGNERFVAAHERGQTWPLALVIAGVLEGQLATSQPSAHGQEQA